jgi:membrane protein DedA with SNARE-associated domain
MLGLIGIISVGVFLYIGYTLFTAQGNEEEFKKAWKALVYAVIGLAVMPLAYIAVKIVTGFTL